MNDRANRARRALKLRRLANLLCEAHYYLVAPWPSDPAELARVRTRLRAVEQRIRRRADELRRPT